VEVELVVEPEDLIRRQDALAVALTQGTVDVYFHRDATPTRAFPAGTASSRLSSARITSLPGLRRWGHPGDIAAAVRFLAFEASWMTGQTIYVDGGFLATGGPMLGALEGHVSIER
jgi:NAD(P)-dependent dehydrogenase (short-subunit alcohol dehydrogenase family)